MKKALVTLGSISMLLMPLASVSCGDEYSHNQIESYFSQFDGRTLYTYKPHLDLSQFKATGVAGRQHKLSDLGLHYIQANPDLDYTIFFDMFDEYSQALGYIDINIKITDNKFGGETSVSRKYTLYGFTPTNSTAKLLTDFSFKIIENQWTTLENKDIIDYYDSSNTEESVERTAEEVGLTLPPIPEGISVTIIDFTRWGVAEDGLPWYRDELSLNVIVDATDPVHGLMRDVITVRLRGFNPSRIVPEYEDELPEDNDLHAFVQTLSRNHSTTLTNKNAYEYLPRFTYSASELGFPHNGNEYGWNIHFTLREVNIYTGTIIAEIGAEALPGTLSDTLYNYSSGKLFIFTGFQVINKG